MRLLTLSVVLVMVCCSSTAAKPTIRDEEDEADLSARDDDTTTKRAQQKKNKNKNNNLVVILTDDQDLTLGGWSPMRQTQSLIADRGVTLSNWFVNTPVCCPSRAEFLTGRYFHNVRVRPLGGAFNTTTVDCMHVNESKTNDVTFGAALATNGYAVGYFGKFLNTCPESPPLGYDCRHGCAYFAYDGGPDQDPGSYVNVSFYHYENGEPHPEDDMHPTAGLYVSSPLEYAGYTTSIIGNKSLEWVEKRVRDEVGDDHHRGSGHAHAPQAPTTHVPFAVIIGHRAPHVPATPAEWYRDEFANLTAPRDDAYNASAEILADHHWLIRQQGPITEEQGEEIDELFRNRWRALLSVDDAVAALYYKLEESLNDVLESTYFVLTSDHGYNLGQHRLPSCKLNVYDHDVRVPFVVAGPGIRPGSTSSIPAAHVDLAPTLIGLAFLSEAKPHQASSSLYEYDGRDLSALLLSPPKESDAEDNKKTFSAGVKTTTTPVLIEYISLGNVTRTGHLVDDPVSNTYRGLRVIDDETDFLYAEFTAVENVDNFTQDIVTFREAFDLATDPDQLHNIYEDLPPALQTALADDLDARWTCSGAACHAPLDLPGVPSKRLHHPHPGRRATTTSEDAEEINAPPPRSSLLRVLYVKGVVFCAMLSSMMKRLSFFFF